MKRETCQLEKKKKKKKMVKICYLKFLLVDFG